MTKQYSWLVATVPTGKEIEAAMQFSKFLFSSEPPYNNCLRSVAVPRDRKQETTKTRASKYSIRFPGYLFIEVLLPVDRGQQEVYIDFFKDHPLIYRFLGFEAFRKLPHKQKLIVRVSKVASSEIQRATNASELFFVPSVRTNFSVGDTVKTNDGFVGIVSAVLDSANVKVVSCHNPDFSFRTKTRTLEKVTL